MILSEARGLLFDVVVPTIDNEENVAKFDRYLNLVQERFINSGKWTRMIQDVAIVTSNGIFTLPPKYVAALAAKSCSGCPLSIANRWFVYRNTNCCLAEDYSAFSYYGYQQIQDLGDGFATFLDSPYATYYLRFTYGNVADQGMQVLVKGYDAGGSPIFSSDGVISYEGLTVTLNTAITTTTQAFSGRLEFLKKLRSQGFLSLDAVDTITGGATRIGYYAPSETEPSYRRYWIDCGNCNGTNSSNAVYALCKVRYQPAVADSDEVIPGNASALRAGLAALKCEAEGDVTRRDSFLNDGLKILSDEARENRGGAKFSLRIDPGAYQFGRLYNKGRWSRLWSRW
jgi:hypothetical protein